MKIPIVTGAGERFLLDSDDYPRMVLAEVCADVDPRAWELFVEPLHDGVYPDQHGATEAVPS